MMMAFAPLREWHGNRGWETIMTTSTWTGATPPAIGKALVFMAMILIGDLPPLPACAQFNYPMIIVPPPAQNYVAPSPAPKAPPPPDKPADAPNPRDVSQCYQGRAKICPN
jgi:hypothetical protein